MTNQFSVGTDPLGLNDLGIVADAGDRPSVSADSLDGTSYQIGLLSAASFRVGHTSVFTFSNVVPAGEVGSSVVTTHFASPIKETIPMVMLTMYVGTDNTAATKWPQGSTLTASPTTIPIVSIVQDHDAGDFANGTYVQSIMVKNQSVGAQTYYFHLRYLVPQAQALS